MPAKRRPKKILALDWDARTLRVVQAGVGKRGVHVDRVLSAPIPAEVDPADPQKMGEHIRRVLAQEAISVHHAVVDIPRDQAILNTLNLPITAPNELPGIVAIQIAKELPFPIMEAAMDFIVGPHEPQASTAEVLVAAVRNEVVEHYSRIFDAAGLKLDRVGLRPHANKVAVCELLKHAMPERVLFIDVRPTLTEIDVLRNGDLAFSRAASVMIPEHLGSGPTLSLVREPGAQDGDAERTVPSITTLDRVLQALVLEVTRSIEAYRVRDPGARIDHVVIGGDLGVEEPLADAIQQRLQLTTEIYNPAATFGWEPDEGASAAAFAATLGLVLGQADDAVPQFDFLHPKRSVSKTEEKLRKAPMVAAVAALFALSGIVAFAQYTGPRRATLRRIEAKIAELEGKGDDYKKFLSLVDEVREFDSGQFVWVDVLYDILTALPTHEVMVVNRAEMNHKEGRVTLHTRSTKRDAAMEVVAALQSFTPPEDGMEYRFSASVGSQTEKPGEKYRYVQDLRIKIVKAGQEKKKVAKGT